jgi:hypothetical protein
MSFPRLLLLVFLACGIASIAAVFAACDSDGSLVATDSGADARTFDVISFDGPTPFDAKPASGDGGAVEAAPPGDAALPGFIEFRQVQLGGGQFVAAFGAAPLGAAPGCAHAVADAGACVVTTCPAQSPSDAGVVSLVTAGALTLRGGAFLDAGVEIGADSLGSYLYNTTGPMFATGDTLTVAAAGATVPAFAAQTLAAPGPITLTAPTEDGGTIAISTSKDLTVTWTGGTSGDKVYVDLSAFFTSGASASTVCSWDSMATTGTIPAAALAPLASGTPQTGRSAAVWYQQSETSFTAGRWAIAMRASVNGASPASFAP